MGSNTDRTDRLTLANSVSFCHDHGVDVLSGPIWEQSFLATDEAVTVNQTDPWEVVFELELDGDRLRILLDGDLAVVDRQRE